jgi:hypothetical protein
MVAQAIERFDDMAVPDFLLRHAIVSQAVAVHAAGADPLRGFRLVGFGRVERMQCVECLFHRLPGQLGPGTKRSVGVSASHRMFQPATFAFKGPPGVKLEDALPIDDGHQVRRRSRHHLGSVRRGVEDSRHYLVSAVGEFAVLTN